MSSPSSIEIEALLRERARHLAARERKRKEREVLLDVIVVSRADVRLGLPIVCAREVRRVQVTRVPGAPSSVEGLFQVRGECHSLFDLHSFFFGSARPLGHRESSLVVIVESGERTLGLRIDEVLGPRTIYRDDLHSDSDARKLPFVSHITRDVLNIIDVERLFDAIGAPSA